MAPPNNAQLAQKEARITLALEAFKKGCFSSKRACANAYDISEATLQRYIKGICAPCDIVPRSRKLTTTEESTLIERILSMD
jgi:helix-turn-helix, Psq domain